MAETIRLLSYNVQNGIATKSYRQYVTGGWKHILPHDARNLNLDKIASVVEDADIVALQEVDAGSVRTSNTNLTRYIAHTAGFDHYYVQTNRDFGRFAQHSSGVLSRFQPEEVREYRLPSVIKGRGALTLKFKTTGRSLYVIIVHLALTKRARMKQMAFLAGLIQDFRHVVLMGDFNCVSHAPEMKWLYEHSHLHEPTASFPTFPSWAPRKNIDHILVSNGIVVSNVEVINFPLSDHLPIAMDIQLPPDIELSNLPDA